MTVNPITTGKGNQANQIAGAQSQTGEEAFQRDLSKSEGYDKGALEQAVTERTRLTRTKRVEKARKNKRSLFLVSDDGELVDGEPVYRTVMVDGVMFTLRLLAVA